MSPTPQNPTAPSQTEEEEATRPSRQVQGAAPTVLVVEDDRENLDVLTELLASWGYSPIAASSAEEAEALDTATLDAAVVDVFLPGQSGAGLVTKLRRKHPAAIIIGVSGAEDLAVSRTMKEIGADVFLSKPISSDELAAALHRGKTTWH